MTATYGEQEEHIQYDTEIREHLTFRYARPRTDTDYFGACPMIEGTLRYMRSSTNPGHMEVTINAKALECRGRVTITGAAIQWDDASSFGALNAALLEMLPRYNERWRGPVGITFPLRERIVTGEGAEACVIGEIEWQSTPMGLNALAMPAPRIPVTAKALGV